ncbi:hypothetical protein ACFWR9_27910 [Streptomyces sp. NPDC058534]|uniref:hypothetical protein n=1 Tax=Streptomyces sp. NPDC058534 TaxID=3346541 RepID=UPI003649C297
MPQPAPVAVEERAGFAESDERLGPFDDATARPLRASDGAAEPEQARASSRSPPRPTPPT